MSTPTPMKKPRRTPGPVVRLDSFSRPTSRPPPRSKKQISEDCPNLECGAKNSGEAEDGKTICKDCGTVISEGNLVSEVTYGLASGGAHVVHGFHVAADAATSRRAAVYADSQRKTDSRAQTETAGKDYINQIGMALGMQAHLRDMGINVFKLHLDGFIQGRRIKSVAAVALYIGCRKQTDGNRHMLIDFADVLQIDVFGLGHIYKEMLEHLKLQGNGAVIQPINPEDLVLRFAQNLDFGGETMKVAKDTVRLVQRMDRDWMTPGRRPAGIVGAALIIAARMNNFRRTVREVVYVVKVQEQTIMNRLEEFKATESSGLTVEEFRTIDLERAADPPVFTEQRGGKRKRIRKSKHLEFDDDGDNDQPTVISSRASSMSPSSVTSRLATPASTQQAQLDSQNMPPPPIPIDPSLEEASPSRDTTEPVMEMPNTVISTTSQPPATGMLAGKAITKPPAKRKPGRPPKNITTSANSQVTGETALPADITAALTDPMNLEHATALSAALDSATDTNTPPTTQREPLRPRAPIPTSQEIAESEFADDLEVSDCLLSPEEVAIKTRIWTHENRDYLRAQSAKILKQQLAEANGTARVIIRRRRRKKRMGDMSAYGIGSDEEGMPVAESPEEAVMRMMKRRAFTKKINYDVANVLFDVSESSGSRRGSDVSSLVGAGSPGSGMRMSGALNVTSPGGTTKNVDISGKGKIIDEGEEEDAASVVSDHDRNEQQKELDTVAEAIDDDALDDDEEEDEGPRNMYDNDRDDDYGSD